MIVGEPARRHERDASRRAVRAARWSRPSCRARALRPAGARELAHRPRRPRAPGSSRVDSNLRDPPVVVDDIGERPAGVDPESHARDVYPAVTADRDVWCGVSGDRCRCRWRSRLAAGSRATARSGSRARAARSGAAAATRARRARCGSARPSATPASAKRVAGDDRAEAVEQRRRRATARPATARPNGRGDAAARRRRAAARPPCASARAAERAAPGFTLRCPRRTRTTQSSRQSRRVGCGAVGDDEQPGDATRPQLGQHGARLRASAGLRRSRGRRYEAIVSPLLLRRDASGYDRRRVEHRGREAADRGPRPCRSTGPLTLIAASTRPSGAQHRCAHARHARLALADALGPTPLAHAGQDRGRRRRSRPDRVPTRAAPCRPSPGRAASPRRAARCRAGRSAVRAPRRRSGGRLRARRAARSRRSSPRGGRARAGPRRPGGCCRRPARPTPPGGRRAGSGRRRRGRATPCCSSATASRYAVGRARPVSRDELGERAAVERGDGLEHAHHPVERLHAGSARRRSRARRYTVHAPILASHYVRRGPHRATRPRNA